MVNRSMRLKGSWAHPIVPTLGGSRLLTGLAAILTKGGGSTPGAWPGQAGNPVGHTATPASMPAFASPTVWQGGAWPGAWPGSFTGGTNPTVASGSPGAPNVYAFCSFTAGINLSNMHDIAFVGCQWAMTTNSDYSAMMGGPQCANISFFYCTGRPALSVNIPGGGGYTTWPSAGAGVNSASDGSPTYQISSTVGNYVIMELTSHTLSGSPSPAGLIQFDHCDFWGTGAAIAQSGGGSGGTSITDCWIHDTPYGLPLNGPPYDWHTNGIADTSYGNLSNVTIRNCVVASLANTNALAFQQEGSTHYDNIVVDHCYWSGFGNTFCLGMTGGMNTSQTLVTNCHVTNNVFSTSHQWSYNFIYNDHSVIFVNNSHANGNRWSGNKFSVWPGTNWGSSKYPSWSAANDGQFVGPDSSFRNTDWV